MHNMYTYIVPVFEHLSTWDVFPIWNAGFPVALSLPHFYKGDPSLMHNLEGLYPNASLHSSKLFLNLVSIYVHEDSFARRG